MNKIEELHMQAMTVLEFTSLERAVQVTEDIAIKFGIFLLWYNPVGDEHGNLILWKNVHTGEINTTKELYQEFLKTKL